MSYSPSVEAYVATSGGYVDITGDISSCVVNRSENAISTCDITLMNKDWKYNGVFEPFDRITVFATKKESREQVFTGYISSATRFTLYEKDFKIKAKCSLYQLQKMFWDPGLIDSAELKVVKGFSYSYDAGMKEIITNLICKVGGWSEGNVFIGDGIPDSIEEYARSMRRLSVAGEVPTDIYSLLGDVG